TEGKIIRHLVAGVLGKNPPEPLKANSLAQSIDWDGKDDDGKPVAGEPFRVRVDLGLKPKLDEFLFNEPGRLSASDGAGGAERLGIDHDGNLYHATTAGGTYCWFASGTLLRVFDRQGKYFQTIMPYPSNLPFEKLKGTGAFQVDGRLYPVWHDIQTMRMYPGKETYGHEMILTRDGRLGKLGIGSGGQCLRIIQKDGSVPADGLQLSPPLAPGVRHMDNGGRAWIALSADEKWVYASHLGGGNLVHAVF